jgi:hypothetical protein
VWPTLAAILMCCAFLTADVPGAKSPQLIYLHLRTADFTCFHPNMCTCAVVLPCVITDITNSHTRRCHANFDTKSLSTYHICILPFCVHKTIGSCCRYMSRALLNWEQEICWTENRKFVELRTGNLLNWKQEICWTKNRKFVELRIGNLLNREQEICWTKNRKFV